MTKKNLTHWLKVIIIGVFFGFALQFVRAWTEPTSSPPNGNVGAPINTGSTAQTKQGAINVLGFGSNQGIWATGSNYGVIGQSASNPKAWGALGTGEWGGYFGGSVGSDATMQAPVFIAATGGYMQSPVFYGNPYDGHYIDINGTARLNYGVFDNLYSGGYVQSTVFYDTPYDGHYIDINGTARLNYGVFDNLYSGGWMQSPIFYDANDNGYYVDPNDNSRMNGLYSNNITNYGDIYSYGRVCSAVGGWKCLDNIPACTCAIYPVSFGSGYQCGIYYNRYCSWGGYTAAYSGVQATTCDGWGGISFPCN